MQTTTLLYLFLALLGSILIAFFQYFYKNKQQHKINRILFVLRALSLFLLGVLLINPTIKKREIENTKPILSVLVDNSQSTKYFKEENTVKQLLETVKTTNEINKKFDINFFSFGENTTVLDSLSFDENQTNIFDGITAVNQLYKDNIVTTLLITDGNQTLGNDYEFINSKQAIFPFVIGDTTQFKDVRISQLNANKYTYIKNKFPVETLLFYEGKEKVTTRFSIYHKGKTVFTQRLTFSSTEKTKTVLANLSTTQEGQNYYRASINKLVDEKNVKNNTKNFSVEAIDQQAKILIVSSVLHPDLGTLKKAIESNKQRAVDIQIIQNYKNQLNDYQLIILYQPTNEFRTIISNLKEKNANYFIVSGNNTDWSFINSQQLGFTKNSIHQTENYGAKYNAGFLTFLQKDIGFHQFPPLKDKFGEIIISKPHQTILYQNIKGIESEQPLLATFEQNNQKSAVLFGEGIWKWRATSFRESNTFQDFDEFIGNLIQYVSSNKKRNRLEVKAESLYLANSTVNISAFYTDKNFKFDPRASLQISITNSDTKKAIQLPFSLVNNSYQVEIENLLAGNYDYKVSVEGETLSKYGKFKITDYKVEEQFTNANHQKLQKLANRTKGKLFYKNQEEILIKQLMDDETYFTTQKSTLKEQHLIDWKWILFLIIGLLSIEWFIRKYHGKV